MRATLQSTGAKEVLATFTLPNGEQLTLPVQPIPGAYAGRWVEGRLVEVSPAGEVLDSLLVGSPVAA